MNSLKTIIVIPARLESSRLPQKVLADIAGKPMLWHVYQSCLQVTKASEIHIVTDSELIAQAVKEWGGTVWLTDPHCASGTERIVAILDQLDGDVIVNVQADQPFIQGALIDQLIEIFEQSTPLPDIVTPIYPLNQEKIFDPNLVKVTRRHDDYALYFSRQPIPYVRDIPTEQWVTSTVFWGHIGIYGYRRTVLEQYYLLPPSPLEAAEKLEQLRFLQAGKSILTFITNHIPLSVDTAADLEQARSLIIG
ncbi:acylneuraminate cytidylyltransferase [Thioploca ingrica]|uniref:3-deoxy-manno-octulosonate cytidylyltransferase n=1 Tax=Thioploca ingrica TaxID=40754 RepID=A0A090AHT4_9GAMM|nr:acylneuraminate cytidylyltransferase [Thioploca ingrica]